MFFRAILLSQGLLQKEMLLVICNVKIRLLSYVYREPTFQCALLSLRVLFSQKTFFVGFRTFLFVFLFKFQKRCFSNL